MSLKDKVKGKSAEKLIKAIQAKNKNARIGVHREWVPLPTGLPGLDNHVIGIGGFPRGAITEIAGPSGSAKSALMYQMIGKTQADGGVVALLQPEDAFDSGWAAKFGVIEKEIITGEFSTTEEAFRLIAEFIRVKVDLIVVDSIARLIPKSDFEYALQSVEKLAGKQARGRKRGDQAQILRMWLGILLNGYKDYPKLRYSESVLALINHTTAAMSQYGPQYITTGGTAVMFDPHLRISTWPKGWSKEKDKAGRPLKQLIRIKQEKSRLQWGAKGFVDVWLDAGGNFEEEDNADVLLDLALEKGLVTRKGGAGAIIAAQGLGNFKWRGKDAFKKHLQDNPDFKEKVLTTK